MIATWDADRPHMGPSTSSYNLGEDISAALQALLANMHPPQGKQLDDGTLARVQDEIRDAAMRAGLGKLEVLALPVRLHERSVGLLCLLHPSYAAGLLRNAPGVYNIRLDEVDVVLQNARLLQRLLAERKWLEAIVAQNTNGIAIVDAAARIVGFNAAMERLTGWTLDDAVGHEVGKVFPLKLEHETMETSVVSAVRPDMRLADPHPRDAQVRRRDGEWIDVEATTTTLWDDNGQILGWALTLRDIRARKERERLERIFLSSVSHELQTPIAVIKGFSGLLSDAEVPVTVQQAREKAAIIHEESRRLERMVSQLLYATRLQAGGVSLRREPVDLGGLVIRSAHRLEPLAAERGCTLRVEVLGTIGDVQADEEKIAQVLSNLIENAIKYATDMAPSDGGEGARQKPCEVEVRARDLNDEVEVSVCDRGPGIQDEDRERIFHAFQRGRGATRAAGSGLGLFICKSIVESHGGRIGVDSVEGGGARFYFTLPRSPSPKMRPSS